MNREYRMGDVWTREKPVKGLYWFYGKRVTSTKPTNKLVRISAGAIYYLVGNNFFCYIDEADGIWCELYRPELPTTIL